VLGTEDSIAQVHPKVFTESLFSVAETAGTSIRVGTVEGVVVEDGKATGVKVDGEVVPADVVVISMGPWSAQAHEWGLSLPLVYGQKYHSVLMKPERVLSQAVFFQGLGDPEVYPRPDGDVYVTGFPDSPVLVEEQPGEVEVRADVCDRLVKAVRQVSSEMETAEVRLTQSCHLPVTRDGTDWLTVNLSSRCTAEGNRILILG
jgi:glycine/D-amino acid oxidase-like deaminating enzyme